MCKETMPRRARLANCGCEVRTEGVRLPMLLLLRFEWAPVHGNRVTWTLE